jgi:hypothetical protein
MLPCWTNPTKQDYFSTPSMWMSSKYSSVPHVTYHVICNKGKGKGKDAHLTKPTQWRCVGELQAQLQTFLFSTLTRWW